MQVRLNGVCCWVHGGVAGFMVNLPATVSVRPDFRFIEALYHEQSNIGGYGVLITMNLTTWRTWHKKSRPKAAYGQLLWITVTGT